METAKRYEKFPVWIVAFSNSVSLLIYALGIFILHRIGWYYSLLFAIYIIVLEYRLIRYHCTNCYYWGKICGFGKGRLSSLFFKRGDVSKFCSKEMTFKNMIPDLMISLIPFVTGIVLVILKFDYILLISLILMVLFTTIGNGFVRGNLTCNYCKQKELGCPADKMFNKTKNIEEPFTTG